MRSQSLPDFEDDQQWDIVVPVFNEEARVPELVTRLRKACPGARLIFVDNASTDSTREALQTAGVAVAVRHETNLGYGSSLLDGMKAGRGAIMVVIDADLEYFPEDIPAVVGGLAGAEACFGSRFAAGEAGMSRFRSGGNALVTRFFNLLYGQQLTDLYTGLRAFRREALPLEWLRQPGFEFVLEASARLLDTGGRIVEVPIRYDERSTGSSKMRHLPEFLKFLALAVRLRFGAARPGSTRPGS